MMTEKTFAQPLLFRNESVQSQNTDSTSPTLHNQPAAFDGAGQLTRKEIGKKALKQILVTDIPCRDLEAADAVLRQHPCAWTRYVALSCYRCLFSLVFLGNLTGFIWVMVEDARLIHFVNAVSGNLMIVGLSRQPLVINALFLVFCAIPRGAPLYVRRQCAKIYCYGGVHSGCGIAAYVWFVGFTILLTRNYLKQGTSNLNAFAPTILALTYLILVMLLLLIIAAYPTIRMALHDFFELTHRYCGWVVLALFWSLLVLLSNQTAHHNGQSLHHVLIDSPSFWFLILTTISIVHPWILLRKVAVTSELISSHVIRLHFGYTRVNFGHGVALSKNPLRDWHSFATFSDTLPGPAKYSETFSCLISRAGDWTGTTINTPPTHLYTKAVPTYGFAYVMKVFRRMIIVTTGSGIGPCLTYLGSPQRPAMRVIWQTRAPLQTYGQRIIDLVYELDANSLIIDSTTSGKRTNMLPLVLQLVRDFDAEAVCVISNPMMTKRLVFDCESRGVPAFGPIFDS